MTQNGLVSVAKQDLIAGMEDERLRGTMGRLTVAERKHNRAFDQQQWNDCYEDGRSEAKGMLDQVFAKIAAAKEHPLSVGMVTVWSGSSSDNRGNSIKASKAFHQGVWDKLVEVLEPHGYFVEGVWDLHAPNESDVEALVQYVDAASRFGISATEFKSVVTVCWDEPPMTAQ